MILSLILSFVSLFGAEPQSSSANRTPHDLVGQRITATVVSVIDGDTVHVILRPKRALRVRLEGVDAPESGEPFSGQARNFIRVLMFSREVLLDGRDVDRYGRLVARVTVDGKDASLELVSAGLACHYRYFSSDRLLDAAELKAKEAGRGFWARDAERPKCVSRQTSERQLSRAVANAAGFVGNVASRVYHATTCRNAGCKNCTRKFDSREAAEAAGFRPAGDCLRR